MADRKSEGAGNRTINIELGILARAVGSKWGVLWPKLKHLEESHDVGRALNADEEQRLVDTAMKNRSRMIGPIIRIALMTGMRRDEIRLLKWRQVDFDAKEITVGKAKTEAGRGRIIPFGPTLSAILSTYSFVHTVCLRSWKRHSTVAASRTESHDFLKSPRGLVGSVGLPRFENGNTNQSGSVLPSLETYQLV